MTMQNGGIWLRAEKERMEQERQAGVAPTPVKLTARELTAKFGFMRRKHWLVNHVRNKLDELELVMNPDFSNVHIDTEISIQWESEDGLEPRQKSDPTPQIGVLEAAKKEPTCVKPNNPISLATTLMQLYDYSQLPVMTSKHSLKGIISWKSIGARFSHGKANGTVQDFMDEQAIEIPITTPMFDAINTIVEHGYVLVRGDENTISGIVTASDLSSQFKAMTGPFILIGEIEAHLRRLIHGKFNLTELKKAADRPEDINGGADLTFGGYCKLLQNHDNWRKLDLKIDCGAFTKRLGRVREIRNDVMHFNPEGLDDSDTMELLDMARFFQSLVRMGAM